MSDHVRDRLRFLSEKFKDVPPAVRVLKIAEEFGEATEAMIGYLRLNPRKLDRPSHSKQDVAKELADVVITAMVAMHDYSDDPVQTLTNRLREVHERAGGYPYALAAGSSPTENEPWSDTSAEERPRVVPRPGSLSSGAGSSPTSSTEEETNGS